MAKKPKIYLWSTFSAQVIAVSENTTCLKVDPCDLFVFYLGMTKI